MATAVSGGSKSRSELRRFGLTVGLAFLALAGLAGWREHLIVAMVLAGIGGPLVLAALLIPGRLGPVERAWMGLAYAISKVTTPIFMGIVYFLVITPVGMLMRALGRDPLEPPRSEESYWMPYSTPGDPEPYDMQRQF